MLLLQLKYSVDKGYLNISSRDKIKYDSKVLNSALPKKLKNFAIK